MAENESKEVCRWRVVLTVVGGSERVRRLGRRAEDYRFSSLLMPNYPF